MPKPDPVEEIGRCLPGALEKSLDVLLDRLRNFIDLTLGSEDALNQLVGSVSKHFSSL
jgi:hypothetical protein